MPELNSPAVQRASLATLFLTIFIDLLGFGIVLPLLPYYARQYGASGIMVGFVVGAYSLMQFFFSPVWGRLSDRIGRRPVLLISLAGSAVGYTVFAFADSLALLFLARILSGIAAANIGTAQAYIADITPPEERARGMGMIGAAFGLGFIFGPPVGGLLSSWGTAHGFHGNFLPGVAAALLSLTALTLGFFALKESKSERSVPRSRIPPQFDRRLWSFIAGQKTLRAVLLTLFLIILAFAGMETTVTLHGRDRFQFTARDFGWFFGLMGVIVAFVQGVMIGGLNRRAGERRLAATGAVSLGIGLVLIPMIYRPSLLYAVAVLVALGQGLSFPSLNALVTKIAPDGERGSILGISASVASLSRIIGPPLGGVLYDAGGARGAFFTTAALVGIAVVLALSIRE
jgi:MFS transporter, DHA1 family, tetracycline resistance protein